jgi:hypothetical protein
MDVPGTLQFKNLTMVSALECLCSPPKIIVRVVHYRRPRLHQLELADGTVMAELEQRSIRQLLAFRVFRRMTGGNSQTNGCLK